jgi:hypothetical protein
MKREQFSFKKLREDLVNNEIEKVEKSINFEK